MLIKIGSAFVDPAEIAAATYWAATELDPERFEVTLHSGEWVTVYCSAAEFEAALIDAGCIENPYPEDEDPPAMTEDELDELRTLSSDGFGFLARDYDRRLYAYRNCPERDAVGWFDPRLSTDGGTVRVCGEFLFVSEHDAEPTEIAPLLSAAH